ncbi:MAG: T9SS type A sorting domain-containing protein [Calditrichaeota bacterium]|nr:T9SS type A sorting domain-containing protein [Calditrichota bacterium]
MKKNNPKARYMMKKILLWMLIFTFVFTALLSQEKDSFYSIQTHFGQVYRPDMDSTQVIKMLDLVQDAGITAIRDEIYWSLIELEPGNFQFPPVFDFYISEALKRNLDVLLILDYNNPLYAPASNSGVSTDSNRTAFANYCRQVAARYFPLGVKNYEIWNEPNIPIFWSPSPNAEDYFKLLEVAYPALKSVSQEIQVIGCATSPAEGEPSPFIPGINFIQQVFDFGGGNYLDAVSFHQYHVDSPPENYLFTEISRLQAIVGNELPIWMTEVGYPTNSGWPYISLDKQANYIPRLFLMGKSITQLKRISYYDLKNDGIDAANPEHNFGILTYDLQPKPAYHSLKAAATLIGNKTLTDQQIGPDVYLFKFSDGDSGIIACWRKLGQKEQELKILWDKLAILNRDGNLQYYSLISGDSVEIQLNENLTYIKSLNELPVIGQFSLSLPAIILFPDQIFAPRISCSDTAEIPIHISADLINWNYTGGFGNLSTDGKFVASQADSGMLIAEFYGIRDTTEVKVVEPANYQLDDFLTATGWRTELANLDSNLCSFAICDSIASTGNTSAELNYQFTFNPQIPRQDYQFRLKNFVPIPGKSDSLLLDVYGDGSPILVGYQFQDVEGKIFTKKLYNFPIDWRSRWRTIPFTFASLRGSVKYPVFLTDIVFYLSVSSMNNGETYSGKIYIDNLRSSVREDTKVLESEKGRSSNLPELKIFPNPTNSEIKISYYVSVRGKISMNLYNLLGQRVLSLSSGNRKSGNYSLRADLSNLTSGLYFIRYQSSKSQTVKKILYLK